MEKVLNIYAVIVTYNGMRWIKRCLECLRNSTIPIVPIVVDNGSTDGSASYIPTNFPEAVWLPQNRNLGFGQANNIGMRYALKHQADYVLLLNQDAYLQETAISNMLSESDGYSLLSPVHLNGDGSGLDKMFRYLIHECDNTIIDDILTHKRLAPSYTVGRINAACWLLPKAVMNDVGGFNPLFFHYGEDENYLQRLEHYGINTVLVPSATVCHDRNEHGNINVFNRKKIHRDILLISCNINLSRKERIIRYLRLLYECYAWELPQKQYKPFAWLKEIILTVVHYRTIQRSRTTEKKKGLTWL